MKAAAVSLAAVAGLCYVCYNYSSKRCHGVSSRRISVAELRSQPTWVSLCGVVFDTASLDGFVGADGTFGDIGGHDATLVFSGCLRTTDNANARQRNVAGDIEATLDKEVDKDTLSAAQVATLCSWLATFGLQFPIVGIMADMYRDAKWTSTVRTVLDKSSTSPQGSDGAPKCPLGFGAKRPFPVTLRPCLTTQNGPWIIFNGTRYDVSNAALFDASSPFHVYIGHDITVALALGSLDPKDFDQPLTPDTNLTYAQQKLLAQYQNAFSSTLAVISSSPSS
ncbi:hypothetical protein SDRG_00827 [Saprolegnia diclina VS20]|uniref:Cytochrome b5 heme-binding domain-containing protein n=1 Tax=Saprolegnia diclina (strain VS20) TaxID=1156394 RepID=T0S9P3_SAPDV|nr:hypothetical protein SDRG_00827 [Saprolegnia diclina VS20]EQC41978.1 hypothetical protein SDRG_00827 [Saprolegnia diclina VS20]|eukprot:XP_008604547.1 hypothetical protein SDRG_00827 [Saprolegnia diclina VS20]